MDNFRVRILQILLGQPHGTDVSMREIAKRLDITSSHVHYYMAKMWQEGILTKEMEGDKGFYKPQAIFFSNVEETLRLLSIIAEDVEDATGENVSNCIRALVQLMEWR